MTWSWKGRQQPGPTEPCSSVEKHSYFILSATGTYWRDLNDGVI